MRDFAFRTIAADGHRARGRAQGVSAEAVTRDLEARGLTVLDVREDASSTLRVRAPSLSQVADALTALGALLNAGLPLPRALDTAAMTSSPALATILLDLRSRVERGDSLSSALSAHPAAFSPMARGVIHAGERAGDLPRAVERLGEQLTRTVAVRQRVVSALIYPMVLAVGGCAALLVLFLFVLPRFATLLEGTGLPVPRSTSLLLAFAGSLRAHWIWVPMVIAAVTAVFLWMRHEASGRRLASRLMLRLPAVGALRREMLAAQAARMLAVLLGGGAPIATALSDAAGSTSDPSLADALERVRGRVVSGSALRAALASESIVPPALVAMVATGEESSRLAEFLLRAAELFEQRAERLTGRVATLAEPVMIIALGGVIGLVALALLQAIYSIAPSGIR